MKGDFTRGHRPDQKRGEKYRRVLLQEGRLVLDSDVAAGVDAVDTLIRDLAADVGCAAGSPNLGFLVTPGPLFALFEDLDRVELPSGPTAFEAYRDHGVKYKDRFPSLYLNATSQAGSVTIRGRLGLQAGNPSAANYYPTLRIWARIASGVQLQVTIDGVPVNVVGTGTSDFVPYDIDLGAQGIAEYDTISIGFPAAGPSNEAWIGLIEGRESAGQSLTHWITKGRYYLNGLEVEMIQPGADGHYPEASFPPEAGFDPITSPLPVGTRFVAYVEGWERLLTHVERKGILEQALGGTLDTTVRTAAIGQVKVALFSPGLIFPQQAADVPKAFLHVDRGDASLDVKTAPQVDNLDPCAIPEAGGYTGPDHRLYRFEVHTGGGIGTATIKWSKNNGADLFAITNFDDTTTGLVTLAAGAEVHDGDFVELLVESDDLGDSAGAVISMTGPSFRPADRAVGQLYVARTTAKTGQIQLLDLVTKTPATLNAGVATKPGPKLRLWHGLIDTSVPGGTPYEVDLGDGIRLELSGTSFRPGDYWQYEARRNKDNANGPWQKSPHGPERLFAPLALFRYDGPNVPLVLERWYDHQFAALCELEADDIAYDGDKAGTQADTVQEAIDELYELVLKGGGCCDVTLDPGTSGDDDGPRIQQAIDQKLPNGGVLCLKPGVYHIRTPIVVKEKHVEVRGCPRATLIREDDGVVFQVGASADLTLSHLVVRSVSPAPIVWVSTDDPDKPTTIGLTVRETALLNVANDGIAIHDGETPVPNLDPNGTGPWQPPIPLSPRRLSVTIEDAIVVAYAGVLASTIRELTVRGSLVLFDKLGVSASEIYSATIIGSRLSGTLDDGLRGAIEALDPIAIETQLAALMENWPPGTGQGFALAVGWLWRGRVEHTAMLAGAAAFIGTLNSFESSSSMYQGTAGPAFRADMASNARFDSDRFGSSRVGLHVPWLANHVHVERCYARAMYGVVFGAEMNGTELPQGDFLVEIDGVRVAHNTFEASPNLELSAGVLFGLHPKAFGGKGGYGVHATARKVEIVGNFFTVSGPLVSICFAILESFFRDENEERTRGIRILDNRIHGGVIGIAAYGPGIEIKRNIVSRVQPKSAPISPEAGIVLVDAPRAVVEANVVRLEAQPDGSSGKAVGILLLEGGGTLASDGVRILSNQISCSPGDNPILIAPTSADEKYSDVEIVGNEIEGGDCSLSGLTSLAVRSNRIRGSLRITASFDGYVTDNIVQGYVGEKLPRLDITGVGGRWQIEDNRSLGHLQVSPQTYAVFPYVDGTMYVTHQLFAAAMGVNEMNLTATLQALFTAEWSLDLKMNVAEGLRADQVVSQVNAAISRVNDRFHEELGAGYVAMNGIVSDIYTSIEATVRELGIAVSAFVLWSETEYHAQVEGNWATNDLLVGHPWDSTLPYQSVRPHTSSCIQIIGNRADNAIVTNAYPHLVMLGNMAETFVPNAGVVQTPVQTSNHDFA